VRKSWVCLLALALALSTSRIGAAQVSLHQAHVSALQDVGSTPTGSNSFHWANDGWIGQDKLFDHASFAFVLGQLCEDQYRPNTDPERGIVIALNMIPWTVKEILDGYGDEGASYKDWLWSAAGCVAALTIH